MELETTRFYQRAMQSARDAGIRELLRRLDVAEEKHEELAHELGKAITASARRSEDQTAQRDIHAAIRAARPGRLMDGSVSTLAPLFAAAFATQKSWPTFLVGLAAAIGAGITMGFAGRDPTTGAHGPRQTAGARPLCVAE